MKTQDAKKGSRCMVYKFHPEADKNKSNRLQVVVYTLPEIVALSLDVVGYRE